MDVNSMLANGAQQGISAIDARKPPHAYPTRHAGNMPLHHGDMSPPGVSTHRPLRGNYGATAGSGHPRGSPAKKDQKHVVFQLIDPQDPRIQARLPMRVMISVHDTTESIITTVKNFYGLYEYGVSFENKGGISIIAAYENFENDMTVYVRTVPQPTVVNGDSAPILDSPKRPTLGAPFEARPSHHGSVYSPSRTAARSAGVRSMSPQSDPPQRSASAAPGAKARASKLKREDNGGLGDADGYSSDDGANASVTSSRRSKTEQVNAEISVDNIVEGGRRRHVFESSELPLFVPPQMPISASISSVSPQRRSGPGNAASPLPYTNQQTFSYTQPLPSPQSYGGGMVQPQSALSSSNGYGSAYYQPPRQLRERPSAANHHSNRLSIGGSGILPTPDPTVGSAISDEDVALQLMRLGDASNFSYGRTSASTADDALSGKAEAPSSDDEDERDVGEDAALPAVPRWPKADVGPQRKKQRMMLDRASNETSGDEYEDQRDGSFRGDSDDIMPDAHSHARNSRPKTSRPHDANDAAKANGRPRANSMAKPKSKPLGPPRAPMSPASMAAHSRKASIASSVNGQRLLGPDEEDLSSKPRCQRCRKSKKGCDRQRPCGRCKDAGIGAEGCVSEDEGNGRKGRYGRHMGVSVKKTDDVFSPEESAMSYHVSPNYFIAPAPVDSKKRKR